MPIDNKPNPNVATVATNASIIIMFSTIVSPTKVRIDYAMAFERGTNSIINKFSSILALFITVKLTAQFSDIKMIRNCL